MRCECLTELLVRLKFLQVVAGERVIEEGQFGREMYVVVTGKMCVVMAIGTETAIPLSKRYSKTTCSRENKPTEDNSLRKTSDKKAMRLRKDGIEANNTGDCESHHGRDGGVGCTSKCIVVATLRDGDYFSEYQILSDEPYVPR